MVLKRIFIKPLKKAGVVDPEWSSLDQDPTSQVVPDPDPGSYSFNQANKIMGQALSIHNGIAGRRLKQFWDFLRKYKYVHM